MFNNLGKDELANYVGGISKATKCGIIVGGTAMGIGISGGAGIIPGIGSLGLAATEGCF
ncbi:bacteriocin [Apilactobacillus micheneri]|uniref:bacteriocin n=1 Tax=Apilactobacillus micheneri TaxID=1899430 RepID=UPI00112E5E9A|nr:bacteriocin [Apilactobacillus micheneri]TPR42356.1 bacteriocin [Apilactobacillus micheneri]TPR47077.1 bacteriocin [Apilactobacillus micheneri]